MLGRPRSFVSPTSASRSNSSRPIVACSYCDRIAVSTALAAGERARLMRKEELPARDRARRAARGRSSSRTLRADSSRRLRRSSAARCRGRRWCVRRAARRRATWRPSAAGRSSRTSSSHVVPAGIWPGQSHDARHAIAAFEHRSLALAQRPGRAGVVAVVEPGAVVGGEDDQRLLIEAVLA